MEVYNRYYKAMYNTAFRIVKDSAEAEDVMQESFLNAFTKLHTFKGDVTFGAWLKRIVINSCLDTIKSGKMELHAINEDVMSMADDGDDWNVPDETTVSEVISAIDNLSEPFRSVVRLFLLEGYDHKEIAGILEISESASRTNLHRGKSILKRTLKHLQYGTGY